MDFIIHHPGKLLGHISPIYQVAENAVDGLGISPAYKLPTTVSHLFLHCR